MVSYVFEIREKVKNNLIETRSINKNFKSAKKEIIDIVRSIYLYTGKGKKSYIVSCIGKEFTHPQIHIKSKNPVSKNDFVFSTKFRKMLYGDIVKKMFNKERKTFPVWHEVEEEIDKHLEVISKNIILKFNLNKDCINWSYEKNKN